MSGVVLQQTFEQISNRGRSGDVHDDGNNTKLRKEQSGNSSQVIKMCVRNRTAGTYQDDENIQTVPQAPEVMETVDTDLQHFLHDVVQDEQTEGHLTHTHKVVPAGHVSNQTHCLEPPGGQHPAGSGELHQQPDTCTRWIRSSFF